MKNIHIVSVSGGASSTATLLRVVDSYSIESVFPVFADTLWEHADVYRFLDDVEHVVGKRIVRLKDGRTPSDVSESQGMIFNSRVAKCTQQLKVKPLQKYASQLQDMYADARVFMHIGFNISDRYNKANKLRPYGRLPSPVFNWRKRNVFVRYPLWWQPRIDDPQSYVESYGLRLPYLYYKRKRLHAHLSNNCAGGCFKQGIKHWYDLARYEPETFKARMAWENDMRVQHKYANYAICARTVNGIKKAYPLAEIWRDVHENVEPVQLRLALMEDDIDNSCVLECTPYD